MKTLAPLVSSKKASFEFINKNLDKKGLRNLLAKVYEEYGAAKTGALANALKDLGFRYATLAGVTISIDDLTVPEQKKVLLAEAEAQIQTATERFVRGEITEVERYTKVIDTWSETTDTLTKMVVDEFDRLNPVYMMAFSGARGNLSQVRQLVGMRGLMADSQGQIIDMPIKTNFKEGLSVTEYIISSYGARKGLVDTALKTADSGYLTRRLVDVAQDVIISEEDCGTNKGVTVIPVREGDKVLVPLKERIVSRTAAVDIVTDDGEVLVQAGDVVSPKTAQAIEDAGLQEVLLRSALTCETYFGVCRKCYGWSLTTNKPVDLGEAIGIMAAQSIGEPGTQLTMRTFHTGGAVSGSSRSLQQLFAKEAGTLAEEIRIKDFRTRHGEDVKLTSRDCVLKIKTKGDVEEHSLPLNSTIFVWEKGAKIEKGQLLAEFDPTAVRGGARRLTERATKDITAAMGGEIAFESFEADEKRDRQGNITRTANRSGTIWLLGGDVYNLPSGSKSLITDQQEVAKGTILAESMLISEHGGEVRLPESLKTELKKIDGENVAVITEGKEFTVIIAAIDPKNAELVQTKKELLWKVKGKKGVEETFIIKAPPDTHVENGSIIAELMDDSVTTPTSGEIRYDDLEVDEQRIVTKAGRVFFIPEEVHQVSKDISLKTPNMKSGMFVEIGTEVVKGVITRTSGILEIVEENDIIREVTVRPGELHRVDDITALNVDDGAVVDAGTEIAPGIKAKERCMVSINFQMADPDEDADMDNIDTSSLEYAEIILRPVQEFMIEPRQVSIAFNTSEATNMSVVPVTQMHYNNGERVRNIEGASLIRTSLVIQMRDYLERLKGLVEITGQGSADEDGKSDAQLKIVVLENVTIRRDLTGDVSSDNAVQTQLLVTDGQVIKPKTTVVKTQVLASTDGTISLGNIEEGKDVRRVLLINQDHLVNVSLKGKATVDKGEFVRMDQILDGESAKATYSGRVVAVTKNGVTLRRGRPYLISPGTQLQVENRALTQRGDLLATLVFERQKTGDIVQGLPRVEELLEGRKPKEVAVLSKHLATAEVIFEDDAIKVYLSGDFGREEMEIPVGMNIVVEDKQLIRAGQPITDGSINPHELLEISGIVAVRKYLVDEVQKVYRSQGVEIADKHIEVIVRQMTKKVRIDDGGDTHLLIGELVDEKDLIEINKKIDADKTPAVGHHTLLGITKASLNTESFISAASFQETTRVLTEAAVEGRRDFLRGLKENVIIGRLIPAGTGFPHFKDERIDMYDDSSAASKSTARKPSAILEEIESMFGSPEITPETIGDLIADGGAGGAFHEEGAGLLPDDDFDAEDDAVFEDEE